MSGNFGFMGFPPVDFAFYPSFSPLALTATGTLELDTTYKCQILLVGGGGGGGKDQGGGGGGGEVIISEKMILPRGSYSYIIGSGGLANLTSEGYNGKGGSTSILSLIARGGTGGRSKFYTGRSGGNAGNTLYLGGNGSNNIYGGGGGGGETQAGEDPDHYNRAGNGGNGVDILVNRNQIYSVGGGGGGGNRVSTGQGFGKHGGGDGGYASVGGSPVANSGGGGGGGSWSGVIYNGTNGAAGLIVIAEDIERYIPS